MSGAATYDELNNVAPTAVERAIALLKSHPAMTKCARELDAAAVVDRNKAMFMLAAAFPDDARIGQFKRFDRPDWHYVNFRYTPTLPLTDVLKTPPFNGKLLDALQLNLLHLP